MAGIPDPDRRTDLLGRPNRERRRQRRQRHHPRRRQRHPGLRGKSVTAPTAGMAKGLAVGFGALGLPYVWGGGGDGAPANDGCARGGGQLNQLPRPDRVRLLRAHRLRAGQRRLPLTRRQLRRTTQRRSISALGARAPRNRIDLLSARTCFSYAVSGVSHDVSVMPRGIMHIWVRRWVGKVKVTAMRSHCALCDHSGIESGQTLTRLACLTTTTSSASWRKRSVCLSMRRPGWKQPVSWTFQSSE